MILCRSCKHVWPNGSHYCGHCGCTLGARLCEHGHANPLNASFCTICGSRRLTTAARATKLGWISRLISGLLLIALVAACARCIAYLFAFMVIAVVGAGLLCTILNTVVPGLGTLVAKALKLAATASFAALRFVLTLFFGGRDHV